MHLRAVNIHVHAYIFSPTQQSALQRIFEARTDEEVPGPCAKAVLRPVSAFPSPCKI